jgi:hypothetical protein
MRPIVAALILAIAGCGQSPSVPTEYRAALTTVCDAIDSYEMALSLEGSGSIIDHAFAAEAARKAAGEAFERWAALDVPAVPVVRGPVEEFRSTDFDLINRPADLQRQCRALDGLLGLP